MSLVIEWRRRCRHRAEIYRRDALAVVDVPTMQLFIRKNDWEHDPLADGDSVNDCVRVAVRIRPMIGREQFQKCEECITIPASNPNQVRTRCISQVHDQSQSGAVDLSL